MFALNFGYVAILAKGLKKARGFYQQPLRYFKKEKKAPWKVAFSFSILYSTGPTFFATSLRSPEKKFL
jgi:hypothetical protein